MAEEKTKQETKGKATAKAESEEKSLMDMAMPFLSGAGALGAGVSLWMVFDLKKEIALLKDQLSEQDSEMEKLKRKFSRIEEEKKQMEIRKKAEEEKLQRKKDSEQILAGIMAEIESKKPKEVVYKKTINQKRELEPVKRTACTNFLD